MDHNKKEECLWHENNNGNWIPSCQPGTTHVFGIGGTPEKNGYIYCHHCGGLIHPQKKGA